MSDSDKGAWRELWDTFFGKAWPVWAGGIILSALNILLFLVKSPWGGSGTYLSWGQNFYKLFGWELAGHIEPVHISLYGLLGTMTVIGAFSAALMGKDFALRIPPAGEILKGFVGGGLMAIGCTVGIGCTIGGFMSGVPALSGGAIILTIGFMIGTWLALQYLLWEMEHLPNMSMGKSFTWLAAKGKSGAWQPILGLIVLAFFLIGASLMYKTNNVLTWFAIIGLILGIVLQRSRFCITRAFREPFMTGEADGSIGVMAALVVGVIGFTVIKYMGVGTMTPGAARALALTWVYPHFWLKALIGGIIFGIGMTIAGGCAVGTLWRTGEGQVKLWFAAIGFLLIMPLSKNFIVPGVDKIMPAWAKMQVFLPDTLGYWGAVLLIFILLALWYVFVKWNERTGKFSAL
jgi:uncharacterized membrane protein YedE/YeeE